MDNDVQNKPLALIIDDETDICYLLKGILKHKNVDAAYAATIAEGEQYLQHNDPAVIFLDNHLPDGFGMIWVYMRMLKDKIVIWITT